MNFTTPDWTTWDEAARLDIWSEDEVLRLCTGKLDRGNVSADERKQVRAYISSALVAGALEVVSEAPFPDRDFCPYTGEPIEEDRRWFRPAGFTAWAVNKFPAFPEEVAELLDPSSASSKRKTNESANEPTNAQLLAIAGLLELLKADKRYAKQGVIAETIAEKRWYGAGETALNTLFAQANKAAKDAQSEAEAKALSVKAATSKP